MQLFNFSKMPILRLLPPLYMHDGGLLGRICVCGRVLITEKNAFLIEFIYSQRVVGEMK